MIERRELGIEESPYLRGIYEHSNDGDETRGFGILASEARLRRDPALEDLLEAAHVLHHLHAPLMARLVASMHRARPVGVVRDTPEEVERALLESPLRPSYLDPFLLEGRLARYLYAYGMGTYFGDEHEPEEAAAAARALVHAQLRGDLASMVAFETHAPWSAWFDEHSCTDWTALLIDRRERRLTLLAFTHSD